MNGALWWGACESSEYFESMRLSSEVTPRLKLDIHAPEDIDAVFAIASDPRTWAHLPRARSADRAPTEEMLNMVDRSWREHGLGSWIARLRHDAALPGLEPGKLVGSGGVNLFPAGVHGTFWNLGYRLHPDCWGHGLATELAIHAIRCAQDVRPETPVVARVLTTNPASIAVVKKAGLFEIWEGMPSKATCKMLDGIPAKRIILAEGMPSAELLDWRASLG